MGLIMDLELYIEELRLHGFKRADREKIEAAVQSEILRLISEEGIPAGLNRDGEVKLAGGRFSVPATASPEQAGVQVARQIFGRWK
jgi:hypothetical protein